ncbi:histone H1.2 [Nicotiana tabacum]|uniref:Histone H1 isoform X2 n=2 Tax=Nicotiana tabacum TaxID=4097 RepID=A5A393_TOBAC|nr:histone H1-like isoform X1 [Nicotiana tomentosiformis]XP_016462345.1 PREDICTED: histone H1-like isoform X2 [Nicotiana tabacum]XP_016462346.1 PREDICTED: histone H1-like isoform X3 [Nicotiana tabacum]ABP87679.1 histone H1E [Nicotiana tabacum]
MASTAAKKTSAPKKPRSHPPYAEMISEAIVALKERTGSSQVAIAKFIEEKQKDLPSNFRKLLLVQLKKLVASGKLTKIKGSFKLAPAAAKPAAPAKPKKTAVAAGAAKTKAVAPKKVVVKKAKAAAPAKKAKKTVVVVPAKLKKTPVKKPAVARVKKTPVKKPAVAKVKKTPAKKVVKKPKSIKSPAKKAKK